MKTLKFKQSGAFIIFDRLDALPIDPEMTKIRNRSSIAELPEQEAVSNKVAEKCNHEAKAKVAGGKARKAKKLIDEGPALIATITDEKEKSAMQISVELAKTTFETESKRHSELRLKCNQCDVDLNDLNGKLDKKRVELIKSNPIHIHPRKNEVVPTEAQYSELVAMVDSLENEQIKLVLETVEETVLEVVGEEPIKAPFPKLVSFEKIPDFIGSQWFNFVDGQWIRSEVVTALNVTKSTVVADELEAEAIERKDLTAEQSEEIRIQDLTAEQKEAEQAGAVENALNQAGAMKTKLEIQGSTAAAALTASKAWYQEQVDLIGVKYA